MFFLWSRKYFSVVAIYRYSIINLDFNWLTHVIKFNPILSWFRNLWDTIFLWINFFPNWLFSVRVDNISKFDCLKLWSDPYCLFRHKVFYYNIGYFNITNFDWPLFFWLLLFSFFLIFGSFFSFLCLFL